MGKFVFGLAGGDTIVMVPLYPSDKLGCAW